MDLKDLQATVKECLEGKQGPDLLYYAGQLTHDLGHVSFIPTITINGNQGKQSFILREFKQAVCDAYTGSDPPDSCNKL